MLSGTQQNLTRLENLFRSLGYRLRYEKGNFKTGSCYLSSLKVVVINKFVTLENKVNALVEILNTQPLDEELLNEKEREFVRKLRQTKLPI